MSVQENRYFRAKSKEPFTASDRNLRFGKFLSCQSLISHEIRSGYGCNDHFFESDTFEHCWEVLVKLLGDVELFGTVIDVGMPVIHKAVKYNCRVVSYNGQILLVRPKMSLANDGNYRESRWFTPWLKQRQVEDYQLPRHVQLSTGQSTVIFGDCILQTIDGATFGFEICEELFTPLAPHLSLGLAGVDIITNGSASHHELRKLSKRLDLIRLATVKAGGVYLYANQQGCDGERVYYDGCAMVVVNGQVVSCGSQFSLDDVNVVVANVDLEAVRSYKGSLISRGMQAALSPLPNYHRVQLDVALCSTTSMLTSPTSFVIHSAEEEISLGPACWLWDYLRRSGMRGFFLPLSGGIDSCSTAVLVYSMCQLVVDRAQRSVTEDYHLNDIRSVVGDEKYVPTDAKDLCAKLLHTCYMSTSNSSSSTQQRAAQLANDIGASHISCDIDAVVNSFLAVFTAIFNLTVKYKVHGGSQTENLALQNVQSRCRMVLSYLFAQLLPWTRGQSGSLLVLGSSNVDECLRGYFTKYDCSSADLNPIGSISKSDLKLFITWSAVKFNLPILSDFVHAIPTAELEPITDSYSQNDEADMGLSYDDLSFFGRLRKIRRYGPVGMFKYLISSTYETIESTPREVAQKVRRMFYYYSVNRHKMTTLTPSYHAESYSPDDNRFDLRPFLYNTRWEWQFQQIAELVGKFQKD